MLLPFWAARAVPERAGTSPKPSHLSQEGQEEMGAGPGFAAHAAPPAETLPPRQLLQSPLY